MPENQINKPQQPLTEPEMAARIGDDRIGKWISEVEDYSIITLDPEGIITSWNKGAEKIKGYKASEVVGKSFRMFYTLEDRDSKFPEGFLEQARSEGKANHEGWRLRKDGQRFWGSVTLTAIHDAV